MIPDEILPWKRAVIKVGSALIAAQGAGTQTKYLLPIASFINACKQQGRDILLVSSGAVAAGKSMGGPVESSLNGTNMAKTQLSIPKKQALSAIGQTAIMQTWSRLFDFPCGQILLTQADFNNRTRYVNIKNTLNELLYLGALPIINENDSTATDELRVGDNDNIAALVACLVQADLFVICTDTDGLYEADPRIHPDASKISHVKQINDATYSLASGTSNHLATGGMRTKIQAADKATQFGIPTIIMDGKKAENFEQIRLNLPCGTLFSGHESPRSAKKHWLMVSLGVEGQIVVDDGAAEAIMNRSASLLPSGISNVEGDFHQGDPIEIKTMQGQVIAKGLTQYASKDLLKIMGRQSGEIHGILGYLPNSAVVHREDLALK